MSSPRAARPRASATPAVNTAHRWRPSWPRRPARSDAMSEAIAKLLSPRSVAVIGASADLKKTTGRPVAYLQKHGFAGRILPVNPRVERIGDLACYPDVASLPERSEEHTSELQSPC